MYAANMGSTLTGLRRTHAADLGNIDDIFVNIAESDPPQYFLEVTAGLPNGCVTYNGFVVARAGDEIQVTVTNLEPVDELRACSAIYGLNQITVPLGSDFEPGREYTVLVNDVAHTFTAQGPGSSDYTTSSDRPLPNGWVAVPSNVESVEIRVGQGMPVEASLVAVVGLPSTCYAVGNYTMTRTTDDIRARLTTFMDPGTDTACAEIYQIVEVVMPLGDGVGACDVYDVTANNIRGLRLQVIHPAVRCANPDETPAPTPPVTSEPDGDAMDVVPAPIETVRINVAESFPPQYFVAITSGLPNGCIRFNDIEVARDGTMIAIAVTNLAPTDEGVMCTQVYGTVENNVQLGTDFQPGVTYTVNVNNSVIETFEAQGGSLPNLDDYKMSVTGVPVPGQPLTIRLEAVIQGGADNHRELYCDGMTWNFGDGMAVSAMPSCLAWSPEVKIPREFEHTYTYVTPGTYEVSFTYGPLGPVTTEVTVR